MAVDATELVDDLRRPANESDSRFLRGIVVPFAADAWRGTREDDVWGEARTEVRAGLDADACPFSSTPNSFIDSFPPAGDAPRDDASPLDCPTTMLARRLLPFALSVGEFAADDRLEMRGIFVGVSLDRPAEGLSAERGGPSLLASRAAACEPPTDGDPAIVGNWCRRRDVSDCFCIELTVWEVARDEPALAEPVLEVKDDCEDDLRLATRCAVDGGKAEICKGGIATGSDLLGGC